MTTPMPQQPQQPSPYGSSAQYPTQPGAAQSAPPIDPNAPNYGGPSGPAPRRRRWIPWVGGVAVIGIIGAAVGFPMVANATQRGADSAQSAAERINTAIGKKDGLEIAKLFSPAEIDSYLKNQEALAKDSGLDELVKADGGDISGKGAMDSMNDLLDAIDIRSSNMEFKVTPRSENIATIDVTKWQLDASVDVNKMADALAKAQKRSTGKDAPQQMIEQIKKSAEGKDNSFNGDVIEKAGAPIGMVLVKENDRWFISPMMTFAEMARTSSAAKSSSSSSRYSSAPKPKGEPNWNADFNNVAGANTASEAVSGLADRIAVMNDTQDALAPEFVGKLALPERRLAMVYAPMLMGNGESRPDPAQPYFKAEWALKEHQISDNLAIVSPGTTKLDFSTSSSSSSSSPSDRTLSFDGAKVSVGGAEGQTLDVGKMLTNPDRVGLAAVKENGTWRVSTVDTIVNLTTMRANDEGMAKGKELFEQFTKSANSSSSRSSTSVSLGNWDEQAALNKNMFGVFASFYNGFQDFAKSNRPGSSADGTTSDPYGTDGTDSSTGTDGTDGTDSSTGTDGSGDIDDTLDDIFNGSNASQKDLPLTNPQTVPAGAHR